MSGDTEVKTQKWTIENQTQTEHLAAYCTLAHSIRYDGGSFQVRQRILDNQDGYAVGQYRAKLLSKAPEMADLLRLLYEDSKEFHDAPTGDEIRSGSHTNCGWCKAEALLTTLEKI